jgi:ribonuclease HI
MIITTELLEQGRSERGGWTRDQLELLGVGWPPPPSGWAKRLVGKEIDDQDGEAFISLRGMGRRRERKPRKKRDHNLKFPPKPKQVVPDLKATIYTDGCCLYSKTTAPGAYAYLLTGPDGITHGEAKAYRNTTNNRMEILGAIAALQRLEKPHDVTLWSDSQYLVNSIMRGWARSWRAKNWWENFNAGIRRKNHDLFKTLLELCEKHHVTMQWIKGHNGHPENERCDKMANMSATLGPFHADHVFESLKKSES